MYLNALTIEVEYDQKMATIYFMVDFGCSYLNLKQLTNGREIKIPVSG